MIRVRDGKVVEAKLPKSGMVNGRIVSGFDRLPREKLRELGWIDESELKKKVSRKK